MAQKYNPLLKFGFQETGGGGEAEQIAALQEAVSALQTQAANLQTALNTLKGNKITKCFSAADLAEIGNGEIIQWQGVDGSTIDGVTFTKGFFYTNGGSVTVPVGAYYIDIAEDVYGLYTTIEKGRYYNTGVQSVTPLGYRSAEDGDGNIYRIFHFGGDVDLPREGDILIIPADTYSSDTEYYVIASASWVSGNTYNVTLLYNSQSIVLTLMSSGGSYSYLQEFSNDNGKIYLYNYQDYTTFSPVVFADTENNNFPVYVPFIQDGTTESEIVFNLGFSQTDSQSRNLFWDSAQEMAFASFPQLEDPVYLLDWDRLFNLPYSFLEYHSSLRVNTPYFYKLGGITYWQSFVLSNSAIAAYSTVFTFPDWGTQGVLFLFPAENSTSTDIVCCFVSNGVAKNQIAIPANVGYEGFYFSMFW